MIRQSTHSRATSLASLITGRQSLPGAICLLAFGASSVFAQQTFHLNDLTPPAAAVGKLNAAAGGKQTGSGRDNTSFQSHAYLFTGNSLTGIDLNPLGFGYSQATSISDDGSQQCGYGWGNATGVRPLLWSGSAASFVNLGPLSGYSLGYCHGVNDGQQVGESQNLSYFIASSHATLWNGAASSIDLHPGNPLFTYSYATAVKGGEQVGFQTQAGLPSTSEANWQMPSHAVRWTGTAASAVDLHPAAFDTSRALATNGVQQGGWGYIAVSLAQHALLWTGDAASVVDLHPAGYSFSRVNALSATTQAGDGWVGTPYGLGAVRHALAWTGSAASVVDLNQYLPVGYTHAVATGIDSTGNIVGYAYNTVSAGIDTVEPPPGAIAVVFAPGPAPAAQLLSITVDAANVAPGALVTGTAALASAAPAGGASINFLSTNLAIAATPAAIVIPEGATSTSFSLPVTGATLTVPASFRIYGTDGAVAKFASITVTPIVNLSSVTVNPVEGGFATGGTVTLSIPAQGAGASVSLTSSNPALLSVPATLLIPAGYTSWGFSATTTAVPVATSVTVTASFNGMVLSSTVALSTAPVVAVSAISMPSIVGGQSFTGTVTVNNFPRNPEGATIVLASGDTGTVQVPATVVIPQYAYSAAFAGTSNVVNGLKNVSVKATYNGSNVTGLIGVNPVPTVTISSADYVVDLQMLKIKANTTYANSILTYGINGGQAIGTMQFELGIWNGQTILATAPTTVTVWNSNGGQASFPVTVKTTTSGGTSTGGGGGGGGGGGASSTYKISIATLGKGTVTTNPAGASFPAGSTVTLTATPAAGSPWIGWTGACTGTATTCTLTMNANYSVSALFK